MLGKARPGILSTCHIARNTIFRVQRLHSQAWSSSSGVTCLHSSHSSFYSSSTHPQVYTSSSSSTHPQVYTSSSSSTHPQVYTSSSHPPHPPHILKYSRPPQPIFCAYYVASRVAILCVLYMHVASHYWLVSLLCTHAQLIPTDFLLFSYIYTASRHWLVTFLCAASFDCWLFYVQIISCCCLLFVSTLYMKSPPGMGSVLCTYMQPLATDWLLFCVNKLTGTNIGN